MKKISICLIAFIIVLFASVSGHCEDNKVRIYFGNGMLNDLEEAKVSLTALQTEIETKIQGTNLEGTIAYNISHNPTGGKLEDFFESAFQILDTKISLFWKFLAGLDVMPDSLQEEYKWISAQIDQAMVVDYPSISDHVEEYNTRLCSGDKVLVVAHSQGNLYANIAYTGINENVIDGFENVSVATPDSYVAGDGPYTTIMEDQVIAIIPLALIRNLDNFDYPHIFDWSGHKFVESYLAEGRPAETKILNDITTTIDTLEWPEGSCDEYLFVTCTVESGDEFCIIWDLENNQMVIDVPLNIGTMASFPCKTTDISNWLAGKSMTGESVINVSDPIEGSPIYYGPSLPPTIYTPYLNDTDCNREGYCNIESASGSDTIEINGIDENGNGGLIADRTNDFVRKSRLDVGTQYQQS